MIDFSKMPAGVDDLVRLGRMLDRRPRNLHGLSVLESLASRWLRVRTRRGGSARLHPNPVQQAFESRRGSRNIVLKARQMGLTSWVAGRFFLRTITRPGTLTLQVAHTQQAAEEIFRIVHRFAESLPAALRTGPLRTSRANSRQIAFPALDSEYRVVTAGDRNAGRGLTAQNLHCSELARWPGNPAETLAGLRASLSPDGEIVLESTPYGVGGCFYEEWQQAPATGTVRHFYPWWMEPSYVGDSVDASSLTLEENELLAREPLSLQQIAFRRQLRSSLHGLARQEYAEDPESCFLASGESIFELDLLDARLPHLPEPVTSRHNGTLDIWLPPVAGKRYIVAVDPAGGGCDGDYSAAQVIDLATGLQCAEFAGHVGGCELAELVTALADEYNQALLVIERNNHGAAIVAFAQMHCRYPRIYERNGQPGWLTNSVSRPALLGRLGAALVDTSECFLSRRLLAECRAFVRRPDGSTGARNGSHDDRVVAMAIALAVRAELLECQGGGCRE
ncbi:MAG TPA: hypothetical protein VK716_14220 [Terracidiphilus sp.]|jgi:hypothetical protein|nr:hypothetical protein [Terracidiphilus sp.]